MDPLYFCVIALGACAWAIGRVADEIRSSTNATRGLRDDLALIAERLDQLNISLYRPDRDSGYL